MPALPAQWFSAYVRALPGVRALLATVAGERFSPTWSQRREIRTTRLRRPHQSRSSVATVTSIASRTNVRDDRETPLVWSGMRGDKA